MRDEKARLRLGRTLKLASWWIRVTSPDAPLSW